MLQQSAILCLSLASLGGAPQGKPGTPPTFRMDKTLFSLSSSDVGRAVPTPGPKWTYGKTAKSSWGRWIAAIELSPKQCGRWTAADAVSQAKRLRGAGFDLVLGWIDGESLAPDAAKARWANYGPSDPAVPAFYRQWIETTGLGFAASQRGCWLAPRASAKPGGAVSPGPCFYEPGSVEYTVRKVRAYRAQLGNLCAAKGGPGLVAWWMQNGSWRNFYYGTKTDQVVLNAYGPTAAENFRAYLRTIYKDDLLRFRTEAGLKIRSWDDVRVPVFADRKERPLVFYLWCRFLEWSRTEAVHGLVKRAGLTNLISRGTWCDAFWGSGAAGGLNPHETADHADVVNVELTAAAGPRYAAMAAMDAVTRRFPRKMALAVLTNPSLNADVPAFHRRMAEVLGRVHNLRGILVTADAGPLSDELSRAVGWWNAFGEHQSALLKGAETVPARIASYAARPNLYLDAVCPPTLRRTNILDDRSRLWTWHFLPLVQSGLAVHCLGPAQVEAGWLKDYRLLYCLIGPHNTAECISRIRKFWDDERFVLAAYDALSGEIDRTTWEPLKHIFRCEPWRLYRRKPLFDRPGEITKPMGYYTITLAHITLPKVGTRVPFYNGLMTLQPLHGMKVYATYKGAPCIVGSTKSLFVGADLATDLAMAVDRRYKDASHPGQWSCPSAGAADWAALRRVLLGFVDYSHTNPPVRVLRGDEPAFDVHASTLVKQPGVHRLVFLANYAPTDQDCTLIVPATDEELVWDLLEGKALVSPSPLKYKVRIRANGVKILLAAKDELLRQAIARQKQIGPVPGMK